MQVCWYVTASPTGRDGNWLTRRFTVAAENPLEAIAKARAALELEYNRDPESYEIVVTAAKPDGFFGGAGRNDHSASRRVDVLAEEAPHLIAPAPLEPEATDA